MCHKENKTVGANGLVKLRDKSKRFLSCEKAVSIKNIQDTKLTNIILWEYVLESIFKEEGDVV